MSCLRIKFCASCTKYGEIQLAPSPPLLFSFLEYRAFAVRVKKDSGCVVMLGLKTKYRYGCLGTLQMQMIGKNKHCPMQLQNMPFATYKGTTYTHLRNMKDPEMRGRHRATNAQNVAPKSLRVITKALLP